MKEKIGLYVGRFQPFHRGHLSVIREALEKCGKTMGQDKGYIEYLQNAVDYCLKEGI